MAIQFNQLMKSGGLEEHIREQKKRANQSIFKSSPVGIRLDQLLGRDDLKEIAAHITGVLVLPGDVEAYCRAFDESNAGLAAPSAGNMTPITGQESKV